MTVTLIDSSAVRGNNTTITHDNADGSVYASRKAAPLFVPLPVPATQTISAITVYLVGTAGTVNIALETHDMNANTVTDAGADDTQVVSAAHAKSVTVPGSFTPGANAVARLQITQTSRTARVAGVKYTYA